MSFDEATRWTLDSPGRWTGEVGADWGQGRTSFGGLPAAGAARALQGLVEPSRTLRSLQVVFAAPVAVGPLEFHGELLREGRSSSFARGEVRQDGSPRVLATGLFAAERSSQLTVETEPRPEAPSPEEVPSVPYIEGVMPRFSRHVEFKPTLGSPPFHGGTKAVAGGWCRFRDPTGPVSSTVVGLLDLWWAPILALASAPTPASSVTWAADIVALPESSSPDDYWFYRSRALSAGGGHSVMRAELWAPDGTLAATTSQFVAVFDQR